jgi:hypothetical protein
MREEIGTNPSIVEKSPKFEQGLGSKVDGGTVNDEVVAVLKESSGNRVGNGVAK